MKAGVDIPGHSAELPPERDEVDEAQQEKTRLRRLACALPEVFFIFTFLKPAMNMTVGRFNFFPEVLIELPSAEKMTAFY